MPDAGLFSLANIAAGILGATLTGPLGGIDLPRAELAQRMLEQPSGYAASLVYADGSAAGHSISGSVPADISDFPETFLRAVMATEDKRFGEHGGLDPFATASALLSGLRGEVRGGSTLSQQAVKNVVTGSDLSLERKVAEAVLAVRAHVDLGAGEIFAAYLNSAWFGRGVTGARRAPMAWFGKDWPELTLGETAFLAALLKGAAYYDPTRHPERALERRNYVIDRMEALGWASPEEASAARDEEINVIPTPGRDEGDLWAARAVSAEMRDIRLPARVRGESALELHLTIDAAWQRISEQALRDGVMRLAPAGAAGRVSAGLLRRLNSDAPTNADLRAARTEAARVLSTNDEIRRVILLARNADGTWNALSDTGSGLPERITVTSDQFPEGYTARSGDILPARIIEGRLATELHPGMQGAVVVMDPRSGAILASIGGYDPLTSEFDRTRAMRQPGSAMKPFLWLAALDLGYAHDAPVLNSERDFFDEAGERWRPQNYDRSQTGLITMFSALERSSNLAAVNIADTIGIGAMATMAERFGAYPAGGMKRVLSAALGSSEVRLRDIVAGYAGLVNEGVPVSPFIISRARSGQQTLWDRPVPASQPAAARQNELNLVRSMLRGVVQRGTGFEAFRGHPVPTIGKTGTSQMHRDAWFIGLTPGIAIGVWLGRDDNTPIPSRLTGGVSAAMVTADILRKAHEAGLVNDQGMRGAALPSISWPPPLLSESGPYWASYEGFGTRYAFGAAGGLQPDRGDFVNAPASGRGEIVIRSLY